MKIAAAIQNFTLPLVASTWLWFVGVCVVFGSYAFWLGYATETSQNSEVQYLRAENAYLLEQQAMLEEQLQGRRDMAESTQPGTETSAEGSEAPLVDPQRSFMYTVKPGDTIWDIATLYDVDVKALMRWNNLGSRSRIFPGDQLIIMVEE